MNRTLHAGDCLDVMRRMALLGDTVHAVVTDPPYGLVSTVKRFGKADAAPAQHGRDGAFARASRGFMGKTWDGTGIEARPETWRLCWELLPPGGHLVAFGGTRTWHRIAVAIEDAGFEIRDTLMWLYGTGFPKSHDTAQSIEKLLTTGAARRPDRDLGGLSRHRFSGSTTGTLIADTGGKVPLTTPEAAAWEGWGTALKPAWEPIILARKPLAGTVAETVLAHGTGALNVDGCRVGDEVTVTLRNGDSGKQTFGRDTRSFKRENPPGRWPANVVHDGSDEVEAAFAAFGERTSGTGAVKRASGAGYGPNALGRESRPPGTPNVEYGDSGSASRFFYNTGGVECDPAGNRFHYSAKASRADRNEGCESLAKRPLLWSAGTQNPGSSQSEGTDKAAQNNHPTVKPTDLMRWLVRLVTPPGGTVLDPFMGSGSTGKACAIEGFGFVGIEQDAGYFRIAEARIAHAAGRSATPDSRALAMSLL